jgi:nitronate monooxygenase
LKALLSKLLGIKYPIVGAPMAGGPSTPELAASVSNAGGLGSLAGGMSAPDAIRRDIAETRKLTNRPFSVNLFVLETPQPTPQQTTRALELLQPIREEFGLTAEPPITKYCEDFNLQFKALLEGRPAMASFTFGILNRRQMSALKERAILVCGSATTVAEALAWEAVGADMICAQGSEAGAHRATFLGDFEASLVGTMALIPQVADAVRIPVIAAGGIMDGRGIAAALTLAAAGVQLGTAFMLCPESGTPPAWKNALRSAYAHETRVSRIYSGKPARGLINEFMRRLDPVEKEIPAYPIQNALTGPIRRAAAKANRPEFMSLWAGQGVSMCREMPAAELMTALIRETDAALKTAHISVWH